MDLQGLIGQEGLGGSRGAGSGGGLLVLHGDAASI